LENSGGSMLNTEEVISIRPFRWEVILHSARYGR
jgi:hypothetical protein